MLFPLSAMSRGILCIGGYMDVISADVSVSKLVYADAKIETVVEADVQIVTIKNIDIEG